MTRTDAEDAYLPGIYFYDRDIGFKVIWNSTLNAHVFGLRWSRHRKRLFFTNRKYPL